MAVRRLFPIIAVFWPWLALAHPCPYDWNIEFSKPTTIKGKNLVKFEGVGSEDVLEAFPVRRLVGFDNVIENPGGSGAVARHSEPEVGIRCREDFRQRSAPFRDEQLFFRVVHIVEQADATGFEFGDKNRFHGEVNMVRKYGRVKRIVRL